MGYVQGYVRYLERPWVQRIFAWVLRTVMGICGIFRGECGIFEGALRKLPIASDFHHT